MHTFFAEPQVHAAAACFPSAHVGIGLCICPFAWANPTDIAVASSTTAIVLNMGPFLPSHAAKVYMNIKGDAIGFFAVTLMTLVMPIILLVNIAHLSGA